MRKTTYWGPGASPPALVGRCSRRRHQSQHSTGHKYKAKPLCWGGSGAQAGKGEHRTLKGIFQVQVSYPRAQAMPSSQTQVTCLWRETCNWIHTGDISNWISRTVVANRWSTVHIATSLLSVPLLFLRFSFPIKSDVCQSSDTECPKQRELPRVIQATALLLYRKKLFQKDW